MTAPGLTDQTEGGVRELQCSIPLGSVFADKRIVEAPESMFHAEHKETTTRVSVQQRQTRA